MCTLKPTVPAPSAPKVYAANIPPATAANVVDVVNALRAAIVGGQSTGGYGGGGQGGTQWGGFSTTKANQFQVVNQQVSTVKVYDPNDPTGQTYVTVKQITGLTMQNPYDGSTWQWNQSQGVPGSGYSGGGSGYGGG